MTIDEAITQLKKLISYSKDYRHDVDTNAIQLGIEALEFLYELRQCTAIDVEDVPTRLPSETES